MLDYTYQLPKWASPVDRGWQVSGATLWKDGTPLTLFIGSDSPGFGNVDGSASDRPNIVDPSILGATSEIRIPLHLSSAAIDFPISSPVRFEDRSEETPFEKLRSQT